MAKRSQFCWQCWKPIEDPAARFCPECGAPLIRSLTWWERFRRRPDWVQALALVAVIVVVGVVMVPKIVDLLPERDVAPTQPVAVVQTVAQATATAPYIALPLDATAPRWPLVHGRAGVTRSR